MKMMAEKETPGTNPKLNYRVPKQIQEEFAKICKEQFVNPGQLIARWMVEFIEKNKKN